MSYLTRVNKLLYSLIHSKFVRRSVRAHIEFVCEKSPKIVCVDVNVCLLDVLEVQRFRRRHLFDSTRTTVANTYE